MTFSATRLPRPTVRLATRLALLLACAAAACAPVPQVDTLAGADGTLPVMRLFADGGPVRRPTRPNAQMARDFLDLTFELESGRALPVLTRFEGPITVRVAGVRPPTLIPDLDRVIARMRREAGLDVRRIEGPAAGISVVTVPRREMQRYVPQAACFVSPRVSSWSEFKATRNTATADWTTLTERTRMAVFIPADVAPQEIRDCLHEELAQAIGPLNDLYRLPDSVFNDDNFNTVLTGFDMLMLRATYAPELRSGMTRAQVAARIPAILARLNPAGGRGGLGPEQPTPRAWINALEVALGPSASASRRRTAATAAVAMARREGWNDIRRAFSLYVLARLSLASDPELSLGSFVLAGRIYAAHPETRIHAAHVAMQVAAFALSSGDAPAVLRITGPAITAARQNENAALLAQLLLMRAAALALSGHAGEAQTLHDEALGWARYGFGSEAEVRARAAEIASLAPRIRMASK